MVVRTPLALMTNTERLLFDTEDVTRAFDAVSALQGRSYQRQGLVRNVAISDDGETISGHVVGTAPPPYRVEITLIQPDDEYPEWQFDATCTCNLSVDCRHAAAVLFEVLARGGNAGHPLASQRSPASPPMDPLEGPVAVWLGALAESAQVGAPAAVKERVIYILNPKNHGHGERIVVECAAVRQLKTGGYGQPRYLQPSTLATSTAQYVRTGDRGIGRLLALDPLHNSLGTTLPDDPMLAEVALHRMIATGRCHWRSKDARPLTEGERRSGRLEWRLLPDGRQVPFVAANGTTVVHLATAAPWYVDTDTMSAGPLDFGLPAPVVSALLKAPPVSVFQVPALSAALAAKLPGSTIPAPADDVREEVISVAPVPCLRLASEEARPAPWLYRPASPEIADIAHLSFDYGGTIVEAHSRQQEIRRVEGRLVKVWRRDQRTERAARSCLEALGLDQESLSGSPLDRLTLSPSDPARWSIFVHRDLPRLATEGWRIELAESFRHRVIDASGEWEAEFTEEGLGGWWFSLDLGIHVDGERVALLPLLVQAIKAMPDRADGIAAMRDNQTLYARLDAGRVVALPFERVAPLVSILVELFDAGAVPADGRLDLSIGEAVALAELEATMRLRWFGGERLRRLASRLAAFKGPASVAIPEGFAATLRAYQRQGLDWLQFLREYELGGILADDMGLGKTVQALAHILTEKRAGRLDRPCLVVCSTSLVPNWIAEAARFAPDLAVVSLHGPDRAKRFGSHVAADLAITTYGLLIQDEEVLLAQEWHLVILDEAQTIKNPAAKTTGIAVRLKARHRLCLTGTPVENHLGDIWSQFAFLMPGLLGDARRFSRVFRNPIEKQGDTERQTLLARRLKPFILRRTKSEVAAELPAKTMMIRQVELVGAQRDLYETVRLAMHEKVCSAVAERGLARSHIVILDALLKLRQACCDPRLVKLDQARRVTFSAKLAHLKEMLPELIEEGRRVLLFSQFTSMLDLIEAELDALRLPYVDLRGDTRDRATPVKRFQAGEVPLFCLSLKAGGAGLNLTAADTVIHYDPWWNPAVEAQATDRAHRIGQDKPVFVYKLIAEGTIEERMLELQKRKAALANGLFDPDCPGLSFEAADLELLFQPLV